MDRVETWEPGFCSRCRHWDKFAAPYGDKTCGQSAGLDETPCSNFESQGRFLARQLAFVERQFVLYQAFGLGLAVVLGLLMSWGLAYFS